MAKYLFILILIVCSTAAKAQLKPGFDADEYMELLRISRQQFDSTLKGDFTPKPERFRMIYRSAEGPLKNRFELWIDKNKTAVISIRGTVESNLSWVENLYAAMVPATGSLRINDSTTFNYHLADNPQAAVHAGWLLGLADLSGIITQKIKQTYRERGIKNFIVAGHSQGAAIAFLLRSHLADLQNQQLIPADIVFKTYCSAPPKPGNIYYSYAYDFLTRGGWGISVTNAADWVPEVPFSVQTIHDFNPVNPFPVVDSVIGAQSFFVRLYARHVYNQLKNPGIKAQRKYEKYLGHTVYKLIKKELPQFKEPAYAHSNLYVRTGTPIILMPDSAYRVKFPDDPKNLFTHHLFWPYYYLTQTQYGGH